MIWRRWIKPHHYLPAHRGHSVCPLRKLGWCTRYQTAAADQTTTWMWHRPWQRQWESLRWWIHVAEQRLWQRRLEYYWRLHKWHHHIYKGHTRYLSGGTNTHQGGSHTSPIHICRRWWETKRPCNSGKTHPQLYIPYQLMSPILTSMIKLQPRERLRWRIDV